MPAIYDMKCFHVALLQQHATRLGSASHAEQCFACADACVNGAVCVGAKNDGSASGTCTPFLKGAATPPSPHGQVRQISVCLCGLNTWCRLCMQKSLAQVDTLASNTALTQILGKGGHHEHEQMPCATLCLHTSSSPASLLRFIFALCTCHADETYVVSAFLYIRLAHSIILHCLTMQPMPTTAPVH